MRPFRYERARDVASACTLAAEPSAMFIAGGTNLVDLMKLEFEAPGQLVDIGRLPLAGIQETGEGGLRMVGASRTVRSPSTCMSVADTRSCPKRFWLVRPPSFATEHDRREPAAADTLFVLLRYDKAMQQAGAGIRVSALEGVNRMHAVIGVSDHCIAAHPSDMAVAMMALDARGDTVAPNGSTRTIPLDSLYRPPVRRHRSRLCWSLGS